MFSVSAVANRLNIPNLLGFLGSKEIPIERVTNGVPTIDTNHAQVHAGNGFSFGHKATLAAAAVQTFTFTIPANVYVHFQALDITTDGGNELTVELFSETLLNVAPGGSTVDSFNRHQQGHGKRATGKLTLAANPSDGDTMTIGTRVYTFKDPWADAVDNIDIGANAAATITNIVRAINASGGTPGTDYGTGTVVNPDVLAYDGPGDTVGFVGRSRGAITTALTETFTSEANLFAAAAMAGGVDPTISDGSQVTVRLGATIDYAGEQIDTLFMPKQASGATRTMAARGDSIEWVQKNDRTFSVRMTNSGSVSAVIVCFRPFWYEEGGA